MAPLTEYTKEKLKENFKEILVEKICREMCRIDNVDPDIISVGFGGYIPKDFKYPLWKARVKYAEAILKLLDLEIGE